MWKWLNYVYFFSVCVLASHGPSQGLPLWCSVHVPVNATHGFDVINLLNKGLAEFDLPNLNFKVQVYQYVNDTLRPALDGKCTFVFDEFDGLGKTMRYPASPNEIDVQINANRFPDEKTLYLTLLHELGHVYGLDHPRFGERDTVMGYVVPVTAEKIAIPITFWASLTRTDVRNLYRAGVTANRINFYVARFTYRRIWWTFPLRIYE
jgi:hypothetical protein